jgi:hypothetical protein
VPNFLAIGPKPGGLSADLATAGLVDHLYPGAFDRLSTNLPDRGTPTARSPIDPQSSTETAESEGTSIRILPRHQLDHKE